MTDGLASWERLYRGDPELYDRLIAGEEIHPAVLDALPDADGVVELGAGTGRLTTYLSSRYDRILACEPATAMRERLIARSLPGVEVVDGRFQEIPAPDKSADLVVSCSAFTAADAHGGDASIAEMERVARRTVAFVWPTDVEWLRDRGYAYRSFDGEMAHEFSSLDEAIAVAEIFYPDVVEVIRERGQASVPYEILGMNAPRDIAWKDLA